MTELLRKIVTYTTANGHKITIKPVPPFLLDDILSSIKYPDIPTYEVETAGGEIEVHPHDETTLESDADKKAWEQYRADLEAAKEQENDQMMKVMFLKGIDIGLEGERFENWKEEQEFLGRELPTSRPALKIKYISTEVLANLHDLSEIMSKIMSQSGVSEEVVDAAVASFQSAISKATAGIAEIETGEMGA